jgi:hypothetical protein
MLLFFAIEFLEFLAYHGYFASIFPNAEGCLFTLKISSFAMQKHFGLIQFYLASEILKEKPSV